MSLSYTQMTNPTACPFIGTEVIQSLRECWVRCGCWIVPYGHGGQNAMTTYYKMLADKAVQVVAV